MSRDLIEMEVHQILDDLEEAKAPWLEKKITLQICKNHEGGLVEDSEHRWFYVYGGYDTTRDIVRDCIKARAGHKSLTDSKAMRLPGFEFMTPRYTVERVDDETGEIEIVGIPVEEMSDEELLAKADMYDAMAESLRLHAAEIRRYVRARRAKHFKKDSPADARPSV